MTLFPSLITICFVILIGIFCCKKEIFNKAQIDGFELLLFKIVMPSYLFVAAYRNDLSALLNANYMAAYLLTFVVLALITTMLFCRIASNISVCIRILAASYVNAAKYTLPVITILFKDPTAAIIGNIIQVIIIQPIFIALLNTIKHKEKSLSKKIFSIITTPLIVMPIIGVLLNYLKVALPVPIVDAISQIGNGASGLGLFAIGLTLGATKITTKCMKLDLISIVLIKNFLHPLIAIFIAYLMKLESYWFNSLIIAASAPTAFVVYLISKQFSTDEELVKKVIALSSLISIISLVFITIAIG